jgi:hypothetical protein
VAESKPNGVVAVPGRMLEIEARLILKVRSVAPGRRRGAPADARQRW